MLVNYLKLSFRLLSRNPFFTTINVLGLAIGFASFYALWEYATTELKADQYHKDFDHIARIGVIWQWTDDGGKTWGSLTIGKGRLSTSPRVSEDFHEVVSSLRIINQPRFAPEIVHHGNKIIVSVGDETGQPRIFKEERAAYTDPNLFTFFTIPLVYGKPEQVLAEANYVVLSQSTARKYFGEQNPVGELLRLNDTITLKVSGVYEDLPHYSHLNFELVISGAGLQQIWNNSDGIAQTTNYVKLNHTAFGDFEAKLNNKADTYWAEVKRDFPHARISFFVQPLAEIPFSQNYLADNFYPKSRSFLFTLAFIAVSVLIMAWVNYVNLSITRISRRLKEVATRKVSGAGPLDMARQFVTESFVTNGIAIAFAFTLIQIIRAPASTLLGIQVADVSSLSVSSIIIFASITVSGILLSGLYPAVISMTYRPRSLFNMSAMASGKRVTPYLLTVSQLAIAIIFILLGFTISLQLNHILNLDTGIDKEAVILIDAPIVKPAHYISILNSFKKEISRKAQVMSVTSSRRDITEMYEGTINVKRVGSDLPFGMDDNTVDEEYIPFYGLRLLAGRNFSKDNLSQGILISRVASTRLGYQSPDEAVGRIIHARNIYGGSSSWEEIEVIGVFDDFRNVSFLNMSKSTTESERGRGMVLLYGGQSTGKAVPLAEKISVRIQPENFMETIATIKSLYEQQFPGNLFSWYFLDEFADRIYDNEKVARNQIVLFTVLAIGIACLGLLGMISNKVLEKTKEIGVRKVLGAQLHQIAQILMATTVRQIIIAILIGIPTAVYLTSQYLEKFSERISLQWWHFALPVVLLVAIMFATVAAVLWKAARSNPVEALKSE
jgi:putative ABC transport system permease protein